jgi:4-alpha-glucanotransferase
VKEQGETLERFATFQALSEWRESESRAKSQDADWREWPDEYRDPKSSAVAEFRKTHAEAVAFHQWLQFEIDSQLAAAAKAARDAGMPIGLYQDLAIGTSPKGSDPWMFPELFASGASVGAPPDMYSKSGQDWGLPPMNPHALAEDRYRYWIRLVRGSLRHAGALRIDHVIGLFRQFWIPEGKTGKDGAYVRFPVDDLMGIIALESTRARALVVGEDLGTVPPEVPPGLQRWGLLSSKVLYFEKAQDGSFKSPATYAPDALATANTHDMPTLAGFWRARDVDLRLQVGLIDSERAAKRARRERNEELDALIARLAAAGIVPKSAEITNDAELRAAVHMMLRRTPSWLVGLSLDDLVGEVEPVNIPGVGPDEFPSWTRRLTMPLEQLRTDPGVRRALGCERAWVADRNRE